MTLKQSSILLSRIALFVIYFWFGFLKIIGMSPASPMVQELFGKTMGHIPFLSFGIFIILFGLFEMFVGMLFLVPGAEKWALILFFIHMITVVLPLFIMPVWTHWFVPTLEGQYIIKNLALVTCALNVWSIVPKESLEIV